MAIDRYPPPNHVLSDLGIEIEASGGSTAVARLPVTPHVLGADGAVHLGVIATLVDVVGGAIAAAVLVPDWMATADLALQAFDPVRDGTIEARGSVLRRGRTTLVVEAAVSARPAGPELAAWGTMTFAVLPANTGGRQHRPVGVHRGGRRPRSVSFGGAGLDRALVDAIGITAFEGPPHRADPAVPASSTAAFPATATAPSSPSPTSLSLPVVDYVRNSFGAVQGGMVALLGEVTAARNLQAAGDGCDVRPVDLQVTYLATGRVGPLVATPRAVAGDPAGAIAVVEVVDAGAGDRLTSLVSVRAVPV